MLQFAIMRAGLPEYQRIGGLKKPIISTAVRTMSSDINLAAQNQHSHSNANPHRWSYPRVSEINAGTLVSCESKLQWKRDIIETIKRNPKNEIFSTFLRRKNVMREKVLLFLCECWLESLQQLQRYLLCLLCVEKLDLSMLLKFL